MNVEIRKNDEILTICDLKIFMGLTNTDRKDLVFILISVLKLVQCAIPFAKGHTKRQTKVIINYIVIKVNKRYCNVRSHERNIKFSTTSHLFEKR